MIFKKPKFIESGILIIRILFVILRLCWVSYNSKNVEDRLSYKPNISIDFCQELLIFTNLNEANSIYYKLIVKGNQININSFYWKFINIPWRG